MTISTERVAVIRRFLTTGGGWNDRASTEEFVSIIDELIAARSAVSEPVASCIVADGLVIMDGFSEYENHNLSDGHHELFTAPPALPDDYFGVLVQKARASADKAMRKYPQPNYVLNKVAEESGEVIKAVIHYTEGREEWVNVEGEIIDNLAMLIRLVTEGDQVIGFTPPEACHTAYEPHKLTGIPQSDHLKRALKLAGEAKELADRIRAEELTLQAPVVPDDVAAALDWIDDFIARCNGDDRGSCNSVNILRRAILAAMPATD
ncbi:Uncharacterised protein [Serratia fonticola]|uniref:hypothetical protein n=1 Tax=Serratia TaxID=613 RepID=UPI00200610C7|nr:MULTISPECIES: hypothetical protein [Serratia]CAI1068782.1 Uncharacterised protein [Serratia fonticola]